AGGLGGDVELCAAVYFPPPIHVPNAIRAAALHERGQLARRIERRRVDGDGQGGAVVVEGGEDSGAAAAHPGGGGAAHAVGVPAAERFEVALEPGGDHCASRLALRQSAHRPRMRRWLLSTMVPQARQARSSAGTGRGDSAVPATASPVPVPPSGRGTGEPVGCTGSGNRWEPVPGGEF